MTPEELVLSDLSGAGAAEVARSYPPDWIRLLDYDVLSDHAEVADAFFQRLLPAMPPGAALDAMSQVGGHYILALSHLDARATAARLARDTIERSLNEVAEELIDGWVWADGPDAGMSKASADQWKTVAEQLRGIHLTIEPPAETDADTV